MAVVEKLETRLGQVESRSQWPAYWAAAIYAAVVGLSIYHHEPWADEAQAWLLARDASLVDLWTKLVHYEGTPGLWHTLLHVLIRLGMPYAGLNITSGLLGMAAAWLLVMRAPLPLLIRFFLPFTFFLCYQYAVVARSYSLLPLLLFACAITYKEAAVRLGLFTTLLLLIAAVSLQGFVISASLAFAFGWSNIRAKFDRKRLGLAAVVYVGGLVVLAASAWPASDAFSNHINYSLVQLCQVSAYSFRDAFTGNWFASLAVIALSLPFLWRGGGLVAFIVSSTGLCAVGSIIYSNVWHQGLLFLIWLFAIWISAVGRRPSAALLLALAIVICFQCYWTIRSIGFDWEHPYSGSLQAARFLQSTGISNRAVNAIGYSCTALQPYFRGNIFSNINGGKGRPAFWVWSARNHTNDPSPLFSFHQAEYVIVGYKDLHEKIRWASLVNMGSYQAVQHFDGNLFWRTAIFEPEAFDLYKHVAKSDDSSVASILNMADPATERQLISGFFAVEGNSWRWTGPAFVVLLKAPRRVDRTSVELVVRLFIPATQIQKLGAMTLSVDVDGVPLSPETFTKSGEFIFRRILPPSGRFAGVLPVNFSFDKAAPPSAQDERELSAIVTSISLQ